MKKNKKKPQIPTQPKLEPGVAAKACMEQAARREAALKEYNDNSLIKLDPMQYLSMQRQLEYFQQKSDRLMELLLECKIAKDKQKFICMKCGKDLIKDEK